MKAPNEEDFSKAAEDYYTLLCHVWNVPNCLGTNDGKHILFNNPKHSGSMHCNHTIVFNVLQVMMDANYKFINTEVGGYVKQSDKGVF
jgi:hypothetical protein